MLSSMAIASIVFGCVFTGALLGMFFRALVPEKHLSSETQDVVKLGIALIATMAALVLGLLVASAKSTYDTRRTQLLQVSADIILLDRVLANYGPETQEPLRAAFLAGVTRLWLDLFTTRNENAGLIHDLVALKHELGRGFEVAFEFALAAAAGPR